MTECLRCHTPIPSNGRFCPGCGVEADGAVHDCVPGSTEELRRRLARTLEGRYEITGLLGQGGMATVYSARDLVLERRVAIKVLPPDMGRDEQLVARFQQEAKTAARLDHPNIIPIYRVESEAGLNYFVMKLVNGRSVDDLLREQGRLELGLARRVLRDAALALGHAHRNGVVHRDVKPANIMLDEDERVLLTDFGIAKALQSTSHLTGTGMLIGTPHFMAPEQAKGGEIDGRADQYALAAVGHQMLTGDLLFDGDTMHAILYKHIFQPPPSLATARPGTPADLCATLERALAKEPAARFPSMEQFAAAVSGESAPGSAPRTDRKGAADLQATVRIGTPERPGPPKAGSRYTWHRVTAGAVVAIALAGWWGASHGPAPAPVAAAPIPREPMPVERIIEPPRAPASATAARDSVPPQPKAPAAEPVKPKPKPSAESRRVALANPPAAERFALLTVASEPWGILFVDDVEVGPTPVADHQLPFGSHRIRIEQEGYRDKTATILVSGPNPIRRRYSLEPGGTP